VVNQGSIDQLSSRLQQFNSKNQLRWVICLLAIAVVLPTVCLLWFMTEAVKNERLAVRQKLINVYSDKVGSYLTSPLRDGCEMELVLLERDNLEKTPWDLDPPLNSHAMIVYDRQTQLVWPLIDKQPDATESELYTEAQRLEYVDRNYPMALECYRDLADSNDRDTSDHIKMAMARCYLQLDDVKAAKKSYHDISYPTSFDPNDHEDASVCNPDVMRARVALAELYMTSGDPNVEEHLSRCLQGIVTLEGTGQNRTLLFTPDVWRWGLNRLTGLAEQTDLDLQLEIGQSKQRMTEQEHGALVSNLYDYENVKALKAGVVTSLETAPALYGIKAEIEGCQVLLIADANTIVEKYLSGQWSKINDPSCFVRLIDDKNRCLAGPSRPDYEPLITLAVGELFPKWKAEVYLRDDDIFNHAASRQTAIYTWTGLLVAVLVLTSGAVATQVISRQMKLNRLKNDFIATVTHELKTPLSSMRVLVDTLLDGTYNDPKQATEYLQLISKENVRLSRLIDNFLTFSRMERHKHVFDTAQTDPADIASCAAEALQVKLNKGNCNFTVALGDELPSISVDKDAMVTVLVNLLDNAYKYAGDDKRIELTVFAQDAHVCFSIKDNGIGMGRRDLRKIFDRFYQADSSLSRRVEGTGLGLSIVKYILDAHNGQIIVDSKPGQGSTFTVKLLAVA